MEYVFYSSYPGNFMKKSIIIKLIVDFATSHLTKVTLTIFYASKGSIFFDDMDCIYFVFVQDLSSYKN